jgi:hypothetical protein
MARTNKSTRVVDMTRKNKLVGKGHGNKWQDNI